jgi:hypothetical protein
MFAKLFAIALVFGAAAIAADDLASPTFNFSHL